MKFLISAFTLFVCATSFAVEFTNDWYTSCNQNEATSGEKTVMAGDGTYKLMFVMPGSFSVFLGKDIRLADFVLKEVIGDQCKGLRQGAETMISSNPRESNPYSDIYNANQGDKSALKAKALELLVQVNGGKARELLQRVQSK